MCKGSKQVQVLLVDDNASDVLLFRKLSSLAGCSAEIHSVSDGEAALDYLISLSPDVGPRRPDIIILDMNMPKKNGLEVLAEIRGRAGLAPIPVYILTTTQNPRDEARCTVLGGSGFLTKPVELDEYERLIRWLLTEELPRHQSQS